MMAKLNSKKQNTILFSLVTVPVLILITKLVLNIKLFNLFQDLFLLKYLPKLGDNTSFGLLFVFGILTSIHCVGMCGGIAISQTVKKVAGINGKISMLLPSLLYNSGRVLSYTFIGAAAGGIGQVISFSGYMRNIIPIIGGAFMVIMAVNLLGIAPAVLRRLNISMPGFAARILLRKQKEGNGLGPFIVGLLSGLMPCGPLQMVQLYALGSRSAVYGASALFVFSIGTVPLLFTFGFLNTIINKKQSRFILKASAVLVLILGFIMIGRGMALFGINIQPLCSMQVKNVSERVVTKAYEGNLQLINTSLKEDSFPEITVIKGIPVKWNIHADEENLNYCNNAIVIPKLKIEKKLSTGDNFIEFIPKEAGTITYTCWMGMIKSKINVVVR